ncbi:GNAT family N-acetyltransferase [Nocardia sp. NPDC059177]|uniref:GNAT family N-acetyltransferase n=1 Tax=Nocardia sp. NPDC059177 TaxID=3346759 RepID=UPI0036ABB09E
MTGHQTARLIAPTSRLHRAWLDAHAEWGPGRHEDGFGLTAADEIDSATGFAGWIRRMAGESAQTTYRWIVDDSQVLGGIALHHQLDDHVRWAGHIGFGIRPSARGHGLAGWALGCMLERARRLGMDRVLLVCAAGNNASARTIRRGGGVLEGVVDTELGPAQRYWITL